MTSTTKALAFFLALLWTASTGHAKTNADLIFQPIADGVWLHTSFKELPSWGPFPSNGLVLVHESEIILIDTAWTDAQTARILAWVKEKWRRPVTRAILTHAHEDKMGGVAVLRANGIATFAHPKTNRLARENGLVPAEHNLVFDARSNVTEERLRVYYPGPGHTVDNIVVAVPEYRVLFGGCLIRPSGARSLGNTADADLKHWDRAVVNVSERFPDAETIIPSHGPPGNRDLLDLTINLVRAADSTIQAPAAD